MAADIHHIKQQSTQFGTEEDRCLQALFATLEVDPSTDPESIITAKGEKVPGTCAWIASNETFLDWLTAPSGLLWVSGGPGKGKTFLSIYTYKLLAEMSNPAVTTCPSQATTICFFCDNRFATRNTAVGVLCGLIYQLIGHHRELLHVILPIWRIQQSFLFQSKSFETLWGLFESMLGMVQYTVYCVLDGLDECKEDSLKDLLHKIERLGQSSRVKLVIFSRRHPKCIKEALGRFPQLKLDPDSDFEIGEDISLFISSRVRDLAERREIMNEKLIGHIEDVLKKKCENTFLWVGFMIKDLMEMSIPRIQEALENLPRGLDETYGRILRQIPPDEDRHLISRMLTWITLAMQPLDLDQLADAVGIAAKSGMTQQEICVEYIGLCGHLLQIVENPRKNWRKVVRFVHQSAKDFILRPAIEVPGAGPFKVDEVEGHAIITDTIFRYVHANDSRVQAFRFDDNHFVWYAVRFWLNHLQMLPQADFAKIMQEHKAMFLNDGSPIGKNLSPKPQLYTACGLGLLAWVEIILANGSRSRNPFNRKGSVNTKTKRRDTPLHAACSTGNLDIVKTLVAAGADPGMPDGNGVPVIRVSLWHTNPEIFKYLESLEIGRRAMEKDLKSRDTEPSLHIAAFQGRYDICELLITKYNCDPRVKSRHTNLHHVHKNKNANTALDLAFTQGHLDVALMLAAVSEYMDAQCVGRKESPRCLQVPDHPKGLSKPEALEVLVKQFDIDINTRDAKGETLLHSAIEKRMGKDFIAKCLELGADPTIRSLEGHSSLHEVGSFVSSPIETLELVTLLLCDERLSINDDMWPYDQTPDNGFNYICQKGGGTSILHGGIGCAVQSGTQAELNTNTHLVKSILDLGAERGSCGNRHSGLQHIYTLCTERRKVVSLRIAQECSTVESRVPLEKELDFINEVEQRLADLMKNYNTAPMLPKMMDPRKGMKWNWVDIL